MKFNEKLQLIYGIKTDMRSVLMSYDVPEEELYELANYPEIIRNLIFLTNAFDIQWKKQKTDYVETVLHDGEYMYAISEKWKYLYADDIYRPGEFLGYHHQVIMEAGTDDDTYQLVYTNAGQTEQIDSVGSRLYNVTQFNTFSKLNNVPDNTVTMLNCNYTNGDFRPGFKILESASSTYIYENIVATELESLDITVKKAVEVTIHGSEKLTNTGCWRSSSSTSNMSSLEKYTLLDAPNADVDPYAFYCCRKLKEVTMPGTGFALHFNTINGGAPFGGGLPLLEKVIFLDPTVNFNPVRAVFLDCPKLHTVTNLDYQSVNSDYYVFGNCPDIVYCRIHNFTFGKQDAAATANKTKQQSVIPIHDTWNTDDLIYTFTNALENNTGFVKKLNVPQWIYDVMDENNLIASMTSKGYTILLNNDIYY